MVNLVPEQVIYFIDTGNHFEETIQYRDHLVNTLNLKTEVISASPEVHAFTQENQTWKDNAEQCCYLNKIEPVEKVRSKHSVWISGLMEWQSDHRASLNIFELKQGMLKFYPLLDQSKHDCELFLDTNNLSRHPLVSQGYDSIGCTHCTNRGTDRIGRWFGTAKTECGLHL
jgi:phosphoadenosine phosphosulfate reductase